MRAALIALLLAACSPPAGAPPASATPAPETIAANPDAAALSAAPLDGQWSFNGDGGTVSAGFGAPESEYLFLIVCEPTGAVRLVYEHELSPDQDTNLRIITDAQTLDLPARSFNEGLPSVTAELAGTDPRLEALAQTQTRFAVEVAGEISVLRWDRSIARTLANCAN